MQQGNNIPFIKPIACNNNYRTDGKKLYSKTIQFARQKFNKLELKLDFFFKYQEYSSQLVEYGKV